jgi:hypothetical protein
MACWKVLAVFAAVVTLTAAPSYAEETAGELLKYCENNADGESQSYCFGKIDGTVTSARVLVLAERIDSPYCVPKSESNGGIVFRVVRYLRENPAAGKVPSSTVIYLALKEAYPCPLKNDKSE